VVLVLIYIFLFLERFSFTHNKKIKQVMDNQESKDKFECQTLTDSDRIGTSSSPPIAPAVPVKDLDTNGGVVPVILPEIPIVVLTWSAHHYWGDRKFANTVGFTNDDVPLSIAIRPYVGEILDRGGTVQHIVRISELGQRNFRFTTVRGSKVCPISDLNPTYKCQNSQMRVSVTATLMKFRCLDEQCRGEYHVVFPSHLVTALQESGF